MQSVPRTRSGRHVIALVAATALALFVMAGTAAAHGELLQASPRADSTVGGEFHQIALQFSGLDVQAPQRIDLLDPSGVPIETEAVRDGQRIVLPIEPLTEPGLYTVTYTINGDDGDVSSGAFVFRFDPAAERPEGLTVGQGTGGARGIDTFAFILLIMGAGIAGYLAHRFRMALREHRAAQHASELVGDDQAPDAAEPRAEAASESGAETTRDPERSPPVGAGAD